MHLWRALLPNFAGAPPDTGGPESALLARKPVLADPAVVGESLGLDATNVLGGKGAGVGEGGEGGVSRAPFLAPPVYQVRRCVIYQNICSSDSLQVDADFDGVAVIVACMLCCCGMLAPVMETVELARWLPR